MTALLRGRSLSEATARPVSIRPPSSRNRAASASAIACDPPRGNGQPYVWARPRRPRPNPAVPLRSSGRTEWAAAPRNSAWVCGVGSRLATLVAPRTAVAAKMPALPGFRARQLTGPKRRGAMSTAGRMSFTYSRPRVSGERSTRSAVPSSNGCASAAGDSIHSTSRPSDRKNGDAAPSGWMAEQTSCRNPGSVSSRVRVLPRAEAELTVAHRHRLACSSEQHRHAVRVPVADRHVFRADVLGALVPIVVRVIGLPGNEPLQQLREVLQKALLELVDAHAAGRVRRVDTGDALADAALADGLDDLFCDVADGEPARGPQFRFALEDLHGALSSSIERATTRPILRVPARYVTGEPSIARPAAGGRLALGVGRRAAPGGPADADRPCHSHRLVAVDGAVHLVALAGLERELDRRLRARADVAALHLTAAAAGLDRQGVVDLAVVRDLEGVGPGLRHRDRAGAQRVLLLRDLDRLDDGAAGGTALAGAVAAPAVPAACGDEEGDRKQEEQAAHASDTDEGGRSVSPVACPGRARSSVGQSSELIIRWSLVRVQAGPLEKPRSGGVRAV